MGTLCYLKTLRYRAIELDYVETSEYLFIARFVLRALDSGLRNVFCIIISYFAKWLKKPVFVVASSSIDNHIKNPRNVLRFSLSPTRMYVDLSCCSISR